MKPQKMNACISPGTSRWSSLRWPSAITASLRSRGRHARRERSTGCASAHEPHEQERAAARRAPPATATATASATQGERVYPPLAFAISAVIAGTTSCRSPITA